jgi:non-ribosomal peptide synthetase-like protein
VVNALGNYDQSWLASSRDDVTLHWTALDGQRELKLVISGNDMTILPLSSVQRGLLVGPSVFERIQHHMRVLLKTLDDSPRRNVDQIPILAFLERALVLSSWSHSSVCPELLREELLQQLFEQQVSDRPHSTAVVDGDTNITYAELDGRANQVAHFLVAQGIGRGAVVALQLPRGIQPYIGLLGVLKAGAAYVPLDPEYPTARVAHILSDSSSQMLLTTAEISARHRDLPCARGLLDVQAAEISRFPAVRAIDTCARPDDVCYIIYTSGSTGKPKGVEVTHRTVCHLVRAESQIFGVTHQDRVYQGLSLAFDAAVEEIWLAWFAGATLVVGTKQMSVAGPELSRMLTDAKVSVLSTVPTLLSLLDTQLPTVRLLILGGEACPLELAVRFCAPERRVVNTYGPTEATVIATYGDLNGSESVTIGRPIPNVFVYILNSAMQLVPPGAIGEIFIGGVGLARGYRGLQSLTDERFVKNPFSKHDGSPRLYRTGDLARFNASGWIEFLGRIDAQVKIRGFRIELAEIESALMALPEVAGAVATVWDDATAKLKLVAYVVPAYACEVQQDALRARLRASLPCYMVPALIETVSQLPTLPSGKVDRKLLPAPRSRSSAPPPTGPLPDGEFEMKIARVWGALFSAHVHRDTHFFLDLGGHSLLAAQAVSQLRQDPQMDGLSILDLYEHPTVRQLGRLLQKRAPQPDIVSEPCDKPVSRIGYRICAAAQLIGLYFVFGMYSLQWAAPYLAYLIAHVRGQGVSAALLATAAAMLLLPPLMLALSLAAKWLIIGRYRAGRYPLWGNYYYRWWLVNRIQTIAPLDMFEGTPFLNIYYRLMGARIGHNVLISDDCAQAFDLLSIGDDVSVNEAVDLSGCVVQGGHLVIGSIEIGRRCVIGARSVLSPSTRMDHESCIEELSLLPSGGVIPRGETWAGSPAQPVENPRRTRLPQATRPSLWHKVLLGAAYAGASQLVPVLFVLSIFPGIILMYQLQTLTEMLLFAPLAALSFVLIVCAEIIATKWILLGRVKPGNYRVHGWLYFRLWLFDAIMDMSLELVGGLYATLYFNPWFRLLGAHIGKNAEISTVTSASPDLLSIEEGAFLADFSLVGGSWVQDGYLILQQTHVGKRSFIGNSSVVPGGTRIGDDCLLGVLSCAPRGRDVASDHTDWLGSPSFRLPRRAINQSFAAHQTYRPTRRLYAQRLAFDAARVLLPSTCVVMVTVVLLVTALNWSQKFSLIGCAALFPVLFCALAAVATLFVVGLKWALIGRFRSSEQPLWSSFVWRNELVTAMHENVAEPLFNALLEGTPYAAWFFRLLGTKIGRRVYIGTSCFTEYDLVEIGDDVCLNDDCTLQTHLFEDRVMKMSTIRIEAECTVGPDSVVLYDTHMKRGSTLGSLSLLMKGESLPPHTHWEGSPARTSRVQADPVGSTLGPFHSTDIRSLGSQPQSRSSARSTFTTMGHQSLPV